MGGDFASCWAESKCKAENSRRDGDVMITSQTTCVEFDLVAACLPSIHPRVQRSRDVA